MARIDQIKQKVASFLQLVKPSIAPPKFGNNLRFMILIGLIASLSLLVVGLSAGWGVLALPFLTGLPLPLIATLTTVAPIVIGALSATLVSFIHKSFKYFSQLLSRKESVPVDIHKKPIIESQVLQESNHETLQSTIQSPDSAEIHNSVICQQPMTILLEPIKERQVLRTQNNFHQLEEPNTKVPNAPKVPIPTSGSNNLLAAYAKNNTPTLTSEPAVYGRGRRYTG